MTELTLVNYRRLPNWLPFAAISAFDTIWVKDKYRYDTGTIQHELTHIDQQHRDGWRFYVRYLLMLPLGWNPWRVRYEAEAYQVQLRAGANIATIAKSISGPLYWWPCRYGHAFDVLKAWRDA